MSYVLHKSEGAGFCTFVQINSIKKFLKDPGQALGNIQVKPCETPHDGAMLVYTLPPSRD